ncbi:MAG: hypothetical protein RLZZ611_2283 [Cyanobacteriota bacterium]
MPLRCQPSALALSPIEIRLYRHHQSDAAESNRFRAAKTRLVFISTRKSNPVRRASTSSQRLAGWVAGCLAALLAITGTGVLPGLSASSILPSASSDGSPSLRSLRKVPGHSPQQTIDRFLALTASAETVIREALHDGMAEPGLFFSRSVHQRADAAAAALSQATEAMNFSQVPVSLRPTGGVGTMLMLRSLLLYDLQEQPTLVIPDLKQVQQQHLQSWSIPDTPITLQRISSSDKTLHQACSQCSSGDFLFSADTLNQVPADFETVFTHRLKPDRRFGADLYSLWALLPGGAIPPKPFLLLPPAVQESLLAVHAGQSLLQWLLLIPVTLVALAILVGWLWRIRQWQKRHEDSEGPWPRLIETAAILPLPALVWAWQWYALDWINLFGPRQEAVLIISRLSQGLLQALLVYLLAESIGQLITLRSGALLRLASTKQLQRRKGAGQILTVARCIGLIGAIVVAIQTGRDLGVKSLTLLALSSVPALAISLGTQQLIRDIADGFSLLLDGQIKAGDHCSIGTSKSGEIKGIIKSLGMRSVRLQQDDGSILSIPNSQVAASVVTNYRFSTGKSFKLNLKIAANQRMQLARLLEQARSALAAYPDLQHGKAEIRTMDQGMSLVVSGQWTINLRSQERRAQQEALLLQLVQLTGRDPAAIPPP